MEQKYDYSKLRGLIREHFGTLANYAEYIGISSTSLNDRLNNKLPFKQTEIDKTIEGMDCDPKNIDEIFFCRMNTENRKRCPQN